MNNSQDTKNSQPEQERCVGCEACIDTACGRDECPKGWPKAAQPEQEPVACVVPHGATMRLEWASVDAAHNAKIGPLYTTPPQRKPQFKEFIKWAGAQGYDCAQTCNSGTGEWIVLNPMTADLWKAWQAAHGIKEH